jgi:membrane fusion protein, heavy metal efflux system
MKTLVLVLLTLSMCGCGGASAERSSDEPHPGQAWLTPQQVKDLQIAVETVERQPVGGVIRAAGRVTFDDLRVAHVFSPVTGRITQILAQPGQRVKKGQPLCVLQSPDLGSAISDMAKARATLLSAEKDYKRQKELLEVHAAAQRDYESAQATFINAKAELDRAERKARMLRQSGADSVTQEYMLPSPIEGEVIMRGANPGLEIQGQYGSGAAVELFTIGELDRVWVLADVFEMDMPRIKKGSPVSVRVVAYPDETFAGQVEWISGALDPTSRTAKVRCSIDNAAHKLHPEMYGTALITVDADTKLALKRSAVVFLGEQPVAFVQTGSAPGGQLRFEQRVIGIEEMAGGDFVPVTRGVVVGNGLILSGMM